MSEHSKYKPFNVTERIKSFQYALAGIRVLLLEQHNARVHLLMTIVVVLLGGFVGLERWEWVAITLTIASVWMAEALNTAVEYVADACMPDYHPLIKVAKDVAAAAVLLFAIAAVVVAGLVFIPHI